MAGFKLKLCQLFLACVLTLSLQTRECHGANILIYTASWYSHRQAIEPLAHKLVDVGHSVTFMTCAKPTKPNPKFKEYCPPKMAEFFEQTVNSFFNTGFRLRLHSTLGFHPSIIASIFFEEPLWEALFDPDTKIWLQNKTFDLVIVDGVNSKVPYGLGYKFNAPTICYYPTGIATHEHELWGMSAEASWHPSFLLSNTFTKELTFWDRLYQEVYPIIFRYFWNWYIAPKQDRFMREYFDLPDMPSIKQLEENVAMVFVNTHFSDDAPSSSPPFIVPIGGMHCELWGRSKPRTKLPKNVAKFIEGAGDDGFFLVSFGSGIAQMSHFPEEVVKIFSEAMKGRKTRFLWKWDIVPENLPENVMAATWFPQQTLLAHPKIKGFISHGGMMSYQQASCYGVPTIIVPIFFDQPYNGRNAELIHETGIHLEFSQMTTETLSTAIDSIITDKRYTENSKVVQKRFLDRPLPPVELALFWTEYVLTHKNTSHLKPHLAMEQYWWQRRLLDVWLVILILVILNFWIDYRVAKFLVTWWSRRKPNSKSKQKSVSKSESRIPAKSKPKSNGRSGESVKKVKSQ